MNRISYMFFKLSRRCTDLLDTVQLLFQAPMLHLMTIVVLSFSLSLMSVFWAITDNVRDTAGKVGQSPEAALFLNKNISANHIETLQRQLRTQTAVKEVVLIEAEQGLAMLNEHYQMGNIIQDLESNPLPPVLRISLKQGIAESDEALDTLRDKWKDLPGVTAIEMDPAAQQQAQTWVNAINRALLILAVLIGVVVFALTFISTRLVLEHHHEEIRLLLRLGATPAYLRFRFIPLGLWLGLSGFVLSLASTYIALQFLHAPIQELTNLYQIEFTLPNTWYSLTSPILLIGTLLSTLFGSYMALGSHLERLRRHWQKG